MTVERGIGNLRRSFLARLLIGWSLLALAWVFANPPFAAPDEIFHYVRAVGIANGHLIGASAPNARIGANPADIRFTRTAQRAVLVPARLDPRPFDCYLPNPHMSAACQNRPVRTGAPAWLVSSVGDYPPLGLLAPAAAVRAGHDPLAADHLGRLAGMLVALGLLVAAGAALFAPAGGWLSQAGILAACTPTAIFLASSLTPSGMAVSAGIALTASLLRLGRDETAPRAVWALFGASGAALALSHPTGLAWALLLAGGFVAATGPSEARRRVRQHMPAALFGIGVFTAGVVAALVWQGLYGPNTPIATSDLHDAVMKVPSQYWNALRDLVAGFGYLEFRLPLAAYVLWFAFVGALAVIAVRAGRRRERRSVMAAGALAFLVPVGVWLLFARATGIGINGREYMPVMVAFPMLAGEVVYRNRARISRQAVIALTSLATLAGVLQFVAWYLNAQRAAVGTAGNLLFVSQPGWSPPLSWWPWIAIAGAGVLMLASSSMGALPPRPRAAALPGQQHELLRRSEH